MTHILPEAVAGYLDDDLTREERRDVEMHLASCLECRQELVEVRQLQRARHRRQWWPVLVPIAAAALIVVALALPRPTPTPSDIRSAPDAEQRLGVVSPPPSTQVPPGPITFTWRSAGPSASYTLTLQEADGRVVWTTAVAETTAVLPHSLAPGPGRTLFWFVDALLPNGRLVSSGVHRLRTPP
jgi:anti-sigma factor RsiW